MDALLRLIGTKLAQIVITLLDIVGLLQILGVKLDKTAVEESPYDLQNEIGRVDDLLRKGPNSLANLMTEIKFISNSHENSLQTILDALVALPAGSSIPTATDNAAGVWGAIDPFSDDEALPYGQELANAHRWATFSIDGGSLPSKRSPFFNVSYPPPSPDTIPSNYTWPKPDWTDIQPYDSLVSWLVRTCPDFTWTTDDSGENAIGYLTSLSESEAPHFTPKLTQTEWLRLYGARAAKAPIWPGIDGVTLGEPTVLTETAIVLGPMDGILLTIDSGPGGAGQWGVGDFRSYYRAGYVVFLDADGHADTTQFVGPDDNIFAPKGMSTAASVVVGLNKATQITVTPWTLL